MNKEKQIEYLKEELNAIQCIKRSLFYDEIDELSIDIKKLNFMEKLFDIAIKILQIEPRTIDNMQVGDYIEFDYINGNKLIRHYKGVVTELGDELFYILNCYNGFYYDQIHYGLQEPIIIPYEFLELWGEINEN